ncbi:bifunctional 4-hydroxy-2-oxoglutarate aldolase/2-dehydro-3-deoxy-phosphogluconate aldolase [Sporosarcina sp. 179-K 8C2 HS]|uniref:bifunctional 4-hydroxy-2-oxoglutarate aldolase/2-dehydro-3-deoxy-phosphogluconate aldolase n=1 Tax=Sporosarcina sp. 179-K 8C2 HS TaxID=3142387 RepID=UPI00399F7A2C
MSRVQQRLNKLKEEHIIPVIRADRFEDAHLAILELKEIGFKTVEITLTTPDALRLIQFWSDDRGLLIGAGTVTTIDEAKKCIEAGAEYIVSPCYVNGLAELCVSEEIICIMSGLTPSEVLESWKSGSSVVKVFPASSMGGASYIQSLKAVFPHILLLPTGGVNSDNITSYFAAGADIIGVGSDLVDLNLISSNNISGFRQKATLFKQKVENYFREGY